MMKSPYSRQSPQRTPQQRMSTTAEKKQVMVLRVHYFDTAPNVGGIEDEEMAFIKNGLADSGKTSENIIMLLVITNLTNEMKAGLTGICMCLFLYILTF